MPTLTFTMTRSEPCKLELFLRQDCQLSRRQLCRLKHIDGGMTCNGQPIRSIDIVQPGDIVRLQMADTSEIQPNPQLTFRPVHRLDRNTSGLVAVAKHPIAAAYLHGRIIKTYLALACAPLCCI